MWIVLIAASAAAVRSLWLFGKPFRRVKYTNLLWFCELYAGYSVARFFLAHLIGFHLNIRCGKATFVWRSDRLRLVVGLTAVCFQRHEWILDIVEAGTKASGEL